MKFSLEKFDIEHLPNIKKLKLERPIIFFDTETTGLNTKTAEIVELMAIKLFPDGSHQEYYSLFNPQGPVDKGASDVHGYTKEKLKKEPRIKDKIDQIYEYFVGSDLSAYNGKRFDIPLLIEEFQRCKKFLDLSKCNIIDPYLIMTDKEPSYSGGKRISKKLGDVYKRFFNEELTNAHAATADIIATFRVFDKQLELFKLPKTIEEIANPNGKKLILNESPTAPKVSTNTVVFNNPKPTSNNTTTTMQKTSNKSPEKERDPEGFLILDQPGKLFKANEKDKNYYFNKGKHNNEKIESKHLGYLKWVAEKSDFHERTKEIAAKLIKRMS